MKILGLKFSNDEERCILIKVFFLFSNFINTKVVRKSCFSHGYQDDLGLPSSNLKCLKYNLSFNKKLASAFHGKPKKSCVVNNIVMNFSRLC